MKSLLRLRSFLAPYRAYVFTALLVLIGLTAVDLVFPAIIRQVIDHGLTGGQTRLLGQAALIVVGLGLLEAGLSFSQRFLTESIAHRVAYDMRNRLYDHVQRQPFTFHDHNQSGQIISRCIEDVRSIQNFTGQGVIEIMRISLLMVGISVILFINNPRLAAIALLPMLPLILITTLFGQRIGRFFLKVDESLGELSAQLQENVSGVQVVRAFAREPHEMERFAKINRKLFRARIRVIGEWSKIMPTTTLLVTLGQILILWFGGQMVLRGDLSLGELVAFNSYMLLLSMPAQQLGWLVNAGGEASAGVERVMEILDNVPDIRSKPGAEVLPALRGEVEFLDVSFNYIGETARALHDIRLRVEPNQVVAVIGATGSGKSSLVNLIPRFYDVSAGSVRVDGRDVRDVELVSLRRQIGLVLQTSLLFSASIRENIAYGRPEAALAEVEAAAAAAQADEFIRQLPEGYDTVVGEKGVTLSGGQRQRIAIARALLLNPRILILDDSTSSVDSETEHLIQRALARLMQGRTTFVIAQRLSTVRRADQIILLDGGRIVEHGTHSQLLAGTGLYRQIYDLQLKDQEIFQVELDEGASS